MLRKSLIQEFIKTVEKKGGQLAIIDGSEHYTYDRLYKSVQCLASALVTTGIVQNSVIACFLDKGVDCVISNLGIGLASAAYMNLDIKSPGERVRAVIDNVEPSILITNTKYLEKCKSIAPANIRVLLIDDLLQQNCSMEDELIDRLSKLIDTDLYCIINTSGSTGVPKSVALGHRSFLDFCDWTFSEYNSEALRCIGSLSPVIFDIYSFELAMLCVNGSCLVLIPDSLAAFPIKILELLDKNRVSFIFWVPTIMVNIANMKLLDESVLDSLRLCWFAGEVFPTKQFNYWRGRLPAVEFSNLYGPIEITLDCTFYKITRALTDDEPIPIGIGCDNTGILILNESDRLCGKGEEGELCVRGSSLAFGYYNNPDKTNSVFVQNPLNTKYIEYIYRTGDVVVENQLGEIIYKGRKDTLVKHLGYRIELGEIEHVIVSKVTLINNCCVVYDKTAKEIVVFLEADTAGSFDSVNLRKQLAKYLPKYMIPTNFIVMDQLPRNANGKIDRNGLAERLLNV